MGFEKSRFSPQTEMARPKKDQPTDAELQILQILWDAQRPFSVREVMEQLNDRGGSERAYTTVMTLMDTMAKKGLVTRQPEGRAFLYEPSRPREHTLESLTSDLLQRAFEGNASLLVANLLAGAKPTPDELSLIQKTIREYKRTQLADEPAPGRP